MKQILVLIIFVSLTFASIDVEDNVLVLTDSNFQEALA